MGCKNQQGRRCTVVPNQGARASTRQQAQGGMCGAARRLHRRCVHGASFVLTLSCFPKKRDGAVWGAGHVRNGAGQGSVCSCKSDSTEELGTVLNLCAVFSTI